MFYKGTWLVLSEIFPAYIKGRAIAVATSFNWSANFVVSITFLSVVSEYCGSFVIRNISTGENIEFQIGKFVA